MKVSESQALFKLAAYCSKAERTEYDIRRKAENWELSADVTDNIIIKLKNENYLNEERYCQSFINDKLKFNKWGEAKIRFELKRKQISDDVIGSCFKNIERELFESPLFALLSSKVKTIKAVNDYERKNKLIRFALGRGYTFEQIKKAIQRLNLNDEEYP